MFLKKGFLLLAALLIIILSFVVWYLMFISSRISFRSNDKQVEIKLVNKNYLERLVKEFKAWDKPLGMGYVKSDGSSGWFEVNKLIFIYTTNEQRVIEISNGNVATLTYGYSYDEKTKTLSIPFSVKAIAERQVKDDGADRLVSNSIIRILYHMTHVLPKAPYVAADINLLLKSVPKTVEVKYVSN